MMSLLLIIEILFFMPAIVKLWKKSVYCTAFFVIMLYFCFVFQIIYLYMPEVFYSNHYVNNTFWDCEQKYWYHFYFFSTFSLFAIWIVMYWGMRLKIKNGVRLRIEKSKGKGRYLFEKIVTLVFFAFALIDLFLFVRNIGEFSYLNSLLVSISEEITFLSIAEKIIRNSAFYIVPLFAITYDKNIAKSRYRNVNRLSAIICFSVLIAHAFITADKSNLFSILIGIGVLYIHNNKGNFGALFKYSMVFFLLYIGIQWGIHRFTSRVFGQDFSILNSIISTSAAQNMFDTFAVIRYNYINPIEVIVSTIIKSFIGNDYPYLFETLGKLYASFNLNATYSFAHFLFADGFVFLGYLGFLYNGIVIGAFILLWQSLTQTNDRDFNNIILCAEATLIMALIRGSGMGNFIKYLYVYIAPIIVIYLLLTGKKIIVQKIRG